MTREEAHEAIDRMFDRIDEEGREALGMGIAMAHAGASPGLDHTTVEADYVTVTHERLIVPLLGAVECLAHALRLGLKHEPVVEREAVSS